MTAREILGPPSQIPQVTLPDGFGKETGRARPYESKAYTDTRHEPQMNTYLAESLR